MMKTIISLSAPNMMKKSKATFNKAKAAREKAEAAQLAPVAAEFIAVLKEAGITAKLLPGSITIGSVKSYFGNQWAIYIAGNKPGHFALNLEPIHDEEAEEEVYEFKNAAELKKIVAKALKGKPTAEMTRIDDGIYLAKEGTVFSSNDKKSKALLNSDKLVYVLSPYGHDCTYYFTEKPKLLTSVGWSSISRGGAVLSVPSKGVIVIGCEDD